VLPEWWDDALAENPANVALAEIAIARMLGFNIPSLRDPDVSLSLPSTTAARLKRTADVESSVLAPVVRVAERLARNLSPCLQDVPAFIGERSASKVRAAILARSQHVGLADLVDFAWQSGVLVAQLADRPARTGRLHGLALYCDDVPAVISTSSSDSPPWQAFRLAHELGHVMLGHVRIGQAPILDASQDLDDPDTEEQQANAFAFEVLTGQSRFSMKAVTSLNAEDLAAQAPALGRRHHIHPGTLLLAHGHSANRMPAAQNALKMLGLTDGAHRIVADRLRAHLQEDLPETAARAAALAGVD
jgi:hypothetical protein